ncbi:MAG: hypothetical protein QOK44_4133, partial [Betaproteobacteria bacterium]|nr:hypothetical protein [Betaproteobacteria bacterium]
LFLLEAIAIVVFAIMAGKALL